ncbi:MAG: penicillin-binding protein 1B [Xanthomonadales bacterium]|nr:Penicillin-binding protein 1B [Xanthomonadales bacterium]MCC6594023.1 penicillin-binding protein 1B [Xanthomonadales bacterium]
MLRRMQLWFWRWFWFGLGFTLGAAGPSIVYLNRLIDARFDLGRQPVASRVYARPLVLAPGLRISADLLQIELAEARYRSDPTAASPGSFRRDGNRFEIHTRSFAFGDGVERAERIQVLIENARVSRLLRLPERKALTQKRLDPARIATILPADDTERLPLPIEQMPALLVAGIQSVEDRNFKDHPGIDPLGILRAMWANLKARSLVQGGSTITQQLVKNTLLSNDRSLRRKLVEMGLALVIEVRFDKRTILESYLNRAYIGQNGALAVHGFGAGAEFYFGRPLESLDAAEIALLIGLVKGPSYYDPRRNPERAITRRRVVLGQMAETGLLNPTQLEAALKAPLAVVPRPPSRVRYPAFVELVRAQIQRDYDQSRLQSEGLTILTTLDPGAQALAEAAMTSSLAAVDKEQVVQGAVVLTRARDGEVLALVGGRDPRAAGFNRALEARRPVGSLLKPFVYLLALSQPARYSLASLISDDPIALKLATGKTWAPKNYDRKSHGTVPLVDALARSYNLATARVGLDIGVRSLAQLIGNLGIQAPADPQPSLILGSIDLSPLEVAQLYQGLASGGQVVPISSVREVLDGQGKALTRFPRPAGNPSGADVVKLVTVALNETTLSGTASSLSGGSGIRLDSAGKTGTSDESRDSWYAGYTGEHLAVVWLGRDDNQPTRLTGASGALKVWTALFRQLPSADLRLEFSDAIRWLPFDTGDGCQRIRFYPVLPPYQPDNTRSCMEALTVPR